MSTDTRCPRCGGMGEITEDRAAPEQETGHASERYRCPMCKGTGKDPAWPTVLTPAQEVEIRLRADVGRHLDPHRDAVGRDYAALLAEIDRLRLLVAVQAPRG